jgi:sarcosine oxidase
MSHDVIVVGAGVMGSATARALSARGLRVALLEQFNIGHVRGSSHGRARIFRFSYPDPNYVGMAMEALDLWRALEKEVGRDILTTTGGLDGGKRLDEHVAALAENGAAHEVLDADEVARRWPFMRLPEGQEVLYQPDAGVVAADVAWSSFVDLARSNGADVFEGGRVLGIADRAEEVEVATEERTFTAPVVVITAGSWARRLLDPLGISLDTKATRETVAFYPFEDPMPTFVDWGDPSVYALPSPGQGLKVGEHIAGPVVDPDDDGSVNDESVARLSAWVAERYPGAPHSPHHAETCLYTVTQDEHFVLERHDRIVVGSPCSGHGFKFAPLIGERLADLATA